ncbi:hypothetical protein PF005_g24339 [Phytophthora fragariae]|uniref:RxLR effector protein n=1 Tax=Phytophthora fragariae TaxID=53985 RepID=A0A6A3QFR7_9STRA|nr:hypothetical protein PF003_g37571 [Phytophthora fragariae]KAE8923658.1 hypothetical protein PF009_g26092 [Phytophthora fragariae]KAE8975050.1 hypothetical protein PF011_g24626 [Phytophthora fragariae]KAE9073806.1 hypothetical protein PF010_g24925 [Phytophthora fragariae]KAE9074428.1 hypothetical protein PF007_g25411 [Phytophthora fragariae]
MKFAISSLVLGLVVAAIASPLNQVAAQGGPTPAPLVTSGVLENRTVTTAAFVNETTTVVTTVLRTEEEAVEEAGEDGDASLSGTPNNSAEPQTNDAPTAYLVNETTIVVTTVQGYRNVTTSVLTVLTPVDGDDQEDDDGVTELLDTPAVMTTAK